MAYEPIKGHAHPHMANQPQDLIGSFGWEQLDHSPYSPDLVPSDYLLFLNLKMHVGGQRHEDDHVIKTTVLQ